MSVPERWARTEQQVALMHGARENGGLCAWCGRALGNEETVYVERFLVGDARPGQRNRGAHHSVAWAPVGAECASRDLLEQSSGREPDRCSACGRGVVEHTRRAVQKDTSCSRRCAREQRVGRQVQRGTVDGPVVDAVRTLTPEMQSRRFEAREHGPLCVWCGKSLDVGEAVYFERVVVATAERTVPGLRPYRVVRAVPIGAECLPPELPGGPVWLAPEPCAGCDRPVYRRKRMAYGGQNLCSRKCAWLASKRSRGTEGSVTREPTRVSGLLVWPVVASRVVPTMSTITPGTWARVRLTPDCPGDGRRPHHPAEDGCRVQVTTVDNDADHGVFGLFKGRVGSYVGPRPDGGLGIGRCFRPDELEPIDSPT